jgi:hypothetical protein
MVTLLWLALTAIAGCTGSEAGPVALALQLPTASGTAGSKESAPTETPAKLQATAVPTNTLLPATPTKRSLPTTSPTITPTASQTPIPTQDTRPTAKYWREWPIIPTLSAKAKEVFLAGQALGNDPHAFSRIGDCQSLPEVFLGIYDTDRYWLGANYEHLQLTIDHFSGFFEQENLTAKDGFSVASVLTPLMADKESCQGNESPLACELRLRKPIIIFISLGTNWKPGAEITFTEYLRQIVDITTGLGVIPVLMTKADNVEQDHLLNQAIAQVAYDTEMPLLNTWAAVQYLPNHGLEEDGIYLIPDAWNERAFTALMTLDALWKELEPLVNMGE